MEPAVPDGLVPILAEDLWNEHRCQIDRAVAFRRSLERAADGRWTGSEAELTSALVHTKTLIDFYRPALGRKLISDRIVWWVSAFPDGELPAASSWGRSMGEAWEHLEVWRPAISTRLGPIGHARRQLVTPEWSDGKGQDFDVVGMVGAATSVIQSYATFLRGASSIDAAALEAVDDAARKVREHWASERRRLPGDDEARGRED